MSNHIYRKKGPCPMHVLDLSPRLRVVADEDPNPINPREGAETPVGVFIPLDDWFSTIPQVHRFPGNLQLAHDVLTGDDNTVDRVERWAWVFYNVAVVHDGTRYWFVDRDAFRALIDEDLSREHQIQVIDQERGAWFQYAKEMAWTVHLERRATFRRSSKHWIEGLDSLMYVWEKVSDDLNSIYLDGGDIEGELALLAKENFGGLLLPTERAAVEAIVDSRRAL